MNALIAPGSTLWLLRHELRLGWRQLLPKPGRNGGRGRLWFRLVVLGCVAALVATVIGAPLARGAHRTHFQPGGPYFLAVDAAGLVIFTLMLAQALNAATQVLYERNDLDLLLSSPLPAQRILTVRGLSTAVLSSLLYLVLASLVVVPLALVGEPRWLAAYPVILCLGLLAASGGLLLAMGLFAVLGARRTRLVAQVLAAVIGAAVFLLFQARNLLPRDQFDRLSARLLALVEGPVDATSPLTWPGRAAAGEPLPLILTIALSGAAFLLVSRALGRRFGANAAAASGAGPAPSTARRAASGGGRTSFAGGPFAALVRKERRLLLRDPWLISQVLLQVVYVLPIGFVILRNAGLHMQFAVAGGAAASVFICGQLGGNLAWVTVAAEDSPELLATAPVTPWTAMRAKLLVALAPVAAIALAPVGIIASLSLPAALMATAGCAASAGSAALLNVWWARPGQRRDFRKRRQGSVLVNLAETGALFLWGAATWLAVAGQPWAPAPAAAALALVLAMRRPVRYRAEGAE